MEKSVASIQRSQLEYETVRTVIDAIMNGLNRSDWHWCNHCYGVCPVDLPSDTNALFQNDEKSWARMYMALDKDLTAKVKQWSDDKLITHARVVSDSLSYIDVDLYIGNVVLLE